VRTTSHSQKAPGFSEVGTSDSTTSHRSLAQRTSLSFNSVSFSSIPVPVHTLYSPSLEDTLYSSATSHNLGCDVANSVFTCSHSVYPSLSLFSLAHVSTPSLAADSSFCSPKPLAILAAKKKYKPVSKKVRPVMTDLPERFRIIRNIVGDPLTGMPVLSKIPPPFQPTQRYTLE